ncbi:tyrosine-protein phosphatase [Stigmatella sp. ncwal1]|uniref:Tyrosine-protein phosphatase n=1 Tax=Stigmatella ashevillensis TaxID=2995309 RepID=A0ABT5DC45_9BACT|nr:tyrosine-protein phosphatase [Stigmatella ashevillena]MDC0711203.1 tyrosine-protein phosphatase [Stigmatella ashevillena]
MEADRELRQIVHPFQRLSNFRDVGGRKTADGRTFRTGVLFRSDELSRLNAGDLVKLQGLGIKLICDLRAPRESQKRRLRLPAASIRVVNVPLHEQATHDGNRRKLLGFLFGKTGGERFREFSSAYYHHLAFDQTARIREVITLLSGEQSLPALIHCTAGKDRTGFVAALIQLLVGVPVEGVMEDYLRTNDFFGPRLEKFIQVMRIMTLFQVSPERMRLIAGAHPEFLNEVLSTLMARYGSVESYLREACGIDQDTLQRLKERLLSA